MRDKDRGHDEPLIGRHGGYRTLMSFQLAQLVYDLTVRFCDRYIDRRSRTHDQMVQAARSGVQNIAEGSQASATFRKTELKLTSVARASLEELKLDYEDFLRHRQLALWPPDDPRRQNLVARRCKTVDEVAEWIRSVHDGRDGRDGPDGPDGPDGQEVSPSPDPKASIESIQSMKSILSIEPTPPTEPTASTPITPRPTYLEIAANAAHTLTGVTCSLLDRQLASLARSFEEEGGFTERLYRVRTARRNGGA